MMRVMNAMRGKGSKVQERSTDGEDDEEDEEDKKQREKIEELKKNWDNTESEGGITSIERPSTEQPTKKLVRNVRNREKTRTRTQRNITN
jgi:hypothetical protein